MSSPKFQVGDLVILTGRAYIRSRRGNTEKPLPSGLVGYVLTVRQDVGAQWIVRRIVSFNYIVRFEGIGPAIEVEEKELGRISPLDRLVREL